MLVIFDIETGGKDPRRHPIIQFAAIAVDGKWQERDALEVKIRFPPKHAEPEALKLNSFDPRVWARHAVMPDDAARVISNFLKKHADMEKVSRKGNKFTVCRVAGHNAASFDCPFLKAWFERRGMFLSAAIYESLDTMHLARWAFYAEPAPENVKLGTLCEWFKIDAGDSHDALADVRATARLAPLLLQEIGRRGGCVGGE